MKDKRREDAWAENHDITLAKLVISHIKNGSTQLAAFEESASRLNRTAAACGFRWNKELRKQYEIEINNAKLDRNKQKQQKKEIHATISSVPRFDDNENISPRYDEAFRQIIKIAKDQAQKFDQLMQDNAKLRIEINELKRQKNNFDSTKTNENVATEDLQTFLKIMNRARNLTSLNLNDKARI